MKNEKTNGILLYFYIPFFFSFLVKALLMILKCQSFFFFHKEHFILSLFPRIWNALSLGKAADYLMRVIRNVLTPFSSIIYNDFFSNLNALIRHKPRLS